MKQFFIFLAFIGLFLALVTCKGKGVIAGNTNSARKLDEKSLSCFSCLKLYARMCLRLCWWKSNLSINCHECIREHAPQCLSPCGFAPSSPSSCVNLGKAYIMITGNGTNILQIIRPILTWKGCGNTCLYHHPSNLQGWNFAPKSEPILSKRFTCWCLSSVGTPEVTPYRICGLADCPPSE